MAAAVALAPVQAAWGHVRIQFDYTYDASGFFDEVAHPERRDALEYVSEFACRMVDDLLAIAPSGDDTWGAGFYRPDTDDYWEIPNPTIPADTLVVYVGARDMSGSLGVGGPGGYSAGGSYAWLDVVAGRGEAGALAAPYSDFGPWGGSISFHSAPDSPWYFGLDSAGLDHAQSDFVSVATHELAHVFGIGTSDSWDTYAGGATFTGPVATAVYGGHAPLGPDHAHWDQDTESTWNGLAQEAAMAPALTIGTRKMLTDLDVAALTDVGWETGANAARWTGVSSDHWEQAANWSNGQAPGATSRLALRAAASKMPSLYRNESVRGLDLMTAGWTVGGSTYTLTIGDAGVWSGGDGGQNTLQPRVTLAADSSWMVNPRHTLVLQGALNLAGRTLTKFGLGTLRIEGTQTHAAGSVLAARRGTVTLQTDAGGAAPARNLTVNVEGGAVEFGATQHLAALNLTSGECRLTPSGAKVIVTAALAVDPARAVLDLADNHLIVDYPQGGPNPATDVRDWVAAGLNLAGGGHWDGLGIRSSLAASHPEGLTAVGVIDNTDAKVGGKTQFAGQAVDATSVLAAYTWWGDANFDGVVDANDYDVIDKNFLFTPATAGWWTGDFNYDGVIDANDYDRIDRAFLFQTGPLGGPAAGAVPEPATLALAALGMGLLAAFRRHGSARKRAHG